MDENIYTIDMRNIICTICVNEWLNRDPRILPCQHIYCFACLEDEPLENFYLKCPICSKTVYLENAIIDNLPKYTPNSSIINQQEDRIVSRVKNSLSIFP